MITKIERDLMDLEKMSNSSHKKILNKITKNNKKSSKELKKKISDFMEFFIAEPVSIDPYGIVDKIHNIVKHGQRRELQFVEKIAPQLDLNEKRNIMAAISAASGIHQIIKTIKYYLVIIKKYKNLQIAMIMQMQMPMIKDIAKALVKANDAFVDNAPIGDGIGPFVIASMIPEKAKIYNFEEEEFSYAKLKIKGKNVILSKATGPGSIIGYPGKFVEKLLKKEKIDRIITVDAASVLEGEKDGVIMEGVGVGNRGGGNLTFYHGFLMEQAALKKKIPVDSIGIKEAGENGILPIKEDIYKAVPKIKEKIEEMIEMGPKREKILIVGFGNTCGVGNNRKGLEKTEKIIKKKILEMKKEEEKEKKKNKSFWSNFNPGFGMFLNRTNLSF